MFEEIKQRNELVRDQIYKGFVGGEQLLEKAHQEGDIHPNGKWVWTKLPSGKYDWRVRKGQTKTASSNSSASEKKQDEKKTVDTAIDQEVYDKTYKIATSKEETEKHLKESLDKIESNIKEVKNAISTSSTKIVIDKLNKMLISSVSKKKAIEDALKSYDKVKNDEEPDPRVDNYKTASEKTGKRNPGRRNYGWKNSASGYDARELESEE